MNKRDNNTIYIHIGYPKTGTTSLQKLLFEKQNEIAYITNKLPKEFYELFYFSNTIVWKRYNKEYIEKFFQKESNLLFSTETIMGLSMVPEFEQGGLVGFKDPQVMIEKINDIRKKTKKSIKIIVTIRKQDDMILSLYAQVANRLFSKLPRLKTFDKYYDFIFKDKNYSFIEALNYDLVLQEYEKYFGKDNILLLVFEELKNNPDEYYSKIFTYLNIEDISFKKVLKEKKLNVKNNLKGYKTDKISLKSYLYPFKQKYFPNLKLGENLKNIFDYIQIGGNIRDDILLDTQKRIEILQYFEEYNKNLDRRYNLGLKEHGYF